MEKTDSRTNDVNVVRIYILQVVVSVVELMGMRRDADDVDAMAWVLEDGGLGTLQVLKRSDCCVVLSQ
jgi:hypothetical protein